MLSPAVTPKLGLTLQHAEAETYQIFSIRSKDLLFSPIEKTTCLRRRHQVLPSNFQVLRSQGFGMLPTPRPTPGPSSGRDFRFARFATKSLRPERGSTGSDVMFSTYTRGGGEPSYRFSHWTNWSIRVRFQRQKRLMQRHTSKGHDATAFRGRRDPIHATQLLP